jgi:hypothetical protein
MTPSPPPRHTHPFQVGGHALGAHFTDRAPEIRVVREAFRTPTRLLVHGPRRMGKSSLLLSAAAAARRRRVRVAWVDFSSTTHLADVANRLLRSISHELRRVPERLTEMARSLSPRVQVTFDPAQSHPVLALEVTLRRRPVEDQRAAFEAVLDRMEDHARERAEAGEPGVVVIMDEFQDVLEVGGERADWFLRSIMQRHTHLSYICAGSREALIQELLGEKRAFYKHFQLLPIGPIDAGHLARWIEDRMRTHGVDAGGLGLRILEVAGPRTQDRIQLARELFVRGLSRGEPLRGGPSTGGPSRAGPSRDRGGPAREGSRRPLTEADVDAAFEAIVRAERSLHLGLWNTLTAFQQNALRAVAAAPGALHSQATLEHFGVPSASTMSRTLDALVRRGHLVREEGGVVFDNPYFRAWVELEVLPDVGRGLG